MKFLRNAILISVLGVLFGSISVTEARAQYLGDVLRRMDVYNKSLQSLTADVTMVKYNPQLKASDLSVGNTSYLPKTAKQKMYVRIDWTKPVAEQVSVIGENYELYRPRLNQVITGKVAKAKNSGKAANALAFMNMSKDQLKTNYDVTFIGAENLKDGTKTAHLLLIPKVAGGYKSADLWVDDDGVPRQARITENNDDTTTVLLSNIKRNMTLKSSIFTLVYPGTVKKIRA